MTADVYQALSVKIGQAFAEALRHHQNRQLGDAERLYHLILQNDPNHADSIHLIGVIAAQVGRDDLAIELIGSAIKINESDPTYHSNIAAALTRLGRNDDAVSACNVALTIQPEHAEAHHNLGVALVGIGQMKDAANAFRTTLCLRPDYN